MRSVARISPLALAMVFLVLLPLVGCGDPATSTRIASSTPGVVEPNIVNGSITTTTAAPGGVTIINGTPGTGGSTTGTSNSATIGTYGGLPLTTSAKIGKAITALKSLMRYAITKEPTAPGTVEGTAKIGSEPYLLSAAWCAKTADILAQNLKSITTKLTVNDQAVPLDSVTASTQSIGGQSCRIYDLVVADPPPGTYNINLAYVLATDVNDGFANNPAGTYTYLAHISR